MQYERPAIVRRKAIKGSLQVSNSNSNSNSGAGTQ